MMPGRDKCAPPLEFLGETITRCEQEFDEHRMDDKHYLPLWITYNRSMNIDKFSDAFYYLTPIQANIYAKHGK